MNFKGIAWVENVYQRFEAMCLELEDVIVQDTAKYVESQVQTVGNSMKQFYSDVVQDLLPDDSVVSEKPLPVSMLHEYAPVCSFKKKRESFSGKNRDVKQEQEVTEGEKSGCEMKLRGLDADSTSPSTVHNTRLRNDVGTVKSSDSPRGEVATLNSKEEDSMQTSSSSVPEQLSGRSVEESCIIVDRDELHCVFPDRKENDKHKPYKKIRDAIFSRMKQNREKEYKRLAQQCYAEDVVNGRECGDNPERIEENQSAEESEWELL
ncbi:hypothetical protein IGI04_010204 [Brassica rapa subsp. trilocularis]|uniref:Uncharacterized protein n=1 Tax=Brassica rapa subsp. trilocularis TaxID=1813537 RepID=A0ABQ7MZJ1_BRACM|nr:hypothetical protein IGI04_010204 [Brassica rapa subsp. trilocularis]